MNRQAGRRVGNEIRERQREGGRGVGRERERELYKHLNEISQTLINRD